MAALYGRSIARTTLIACNSGIKRSINTSKVSTHLFQISKNTLKFASNFLMSYFDSNAKPYYHL